jgi:hypothetical protein
MFNLNNTERLSYLPKDFDTDEVISAVEFLDNTTHSPNVTNFFTHISPTTSKSGFLQDGECYQSEISITRRSGIFCAAMRFTAIDSQ